MSGDIFHPAWDGLSQNKPHCSFNVWISDIKNLSIAPYRQSHDLIIRFITGSECICKSKQIVYRCFMLSLWGAPCDWANAVTAENTASFRSMLNMNWCFEMPCLVCRIAMLWKLKPRLASSLTVENELKSKIDFNINRDLGKWRKLSSIYVFFLGLSEYRVPRTVSTLITTEPMRGTQNAK